MRTLLLTLCALSTLVIGASNANAKSPSAGPTGSLAEVFRHSPPAHYNPASLETIHPRLSFTVEHHGNSLQLATAVDGKPFSVTPFAASSTPSLMWSLWRAALKDNAQFSAGEWDHMLNTPVKGAKSRR